MKNTLFRIEESPLAVAIQLTQEAVLCVDQGLEIALFNERAEALFGFSQQHIKGKDISVLADEAFKAQCASVLENFSKDESHSRERITKLLPFNGRNDAGHELALVCNFSPLKVCDGNYLLVFIDKSDRQANEPDSQKLLADWQNIGKSSLELSAITERAISGIHIGELWVESDSGRIIRCNQAALNMLGRHQDRLYGHNIMDCIHDKALFDLEEVLKKCHEVGLYELQLRLSRYDASLVSVNLFVQHHIVNEASIFLLFFKEINEEERENFQLKIALKRQERLGKLGKMAVWHMQADKKIFWDDEMYAQYGIKPDGQMTPSKWAMLIEPEDREKFLAFLLDETATQNSIVIRVNVHGTVFHYYLTYECAVFSGDFKSRLGVSKDQTEWVTQEQKLLKLVSRAIKADHAKSEFLSTMTHELRTPLSGIIGSLELLESVRDLKEIYSLNDIALQSARHLMTIIGDILDFSKIEAGKIEIDREETDVDQLVIDALNALNLAEEHFESSIHVNIQSRLKQVVIDPLRVKQVLVNLLSNAIKFTKKVENRRPTIELRMMLDEDMDKLSLKIQVEDNGIGISQEQQSKLFQPFSQADSSTSRSYGGTGLGLTIIKKFIQLMDGEISVDSVLDQGSTFTVKIPLKAMPVDEQVAEVPADYDFMMVNFDQLISSQIYQQIDELKLPILSVKQDQSLFLLEDLECEHVVIIFNAIQNGLSDVSVYRNELIRAYPNKDIYFLVIEEGLYYEPRKISNRVVALSNHYFRLPAFLQAVNLFVGSEQLAQPEVLEQESIEQENIPAGFRVLLNEDNRTNQKVIGIQLGRLGIEFDLADNGQIGLDMMQKRAYDLVITDLHMPVMNGYEFAKAVRNIESLRHIPIIALTADVTKGVKESCLQLGMRDYLSKPVVMGQLREKIYRHALSLESSDKTDHVEHAQTKDIDEQIVKDILDTDDRELLGVVYDSFIESTDETFAQIQTELESGDTSALRALGHKLKSSAKSAGANLMSDLAFKLERSGGEGRFDDCKDLYPELTRAYEQFKLWLRDFKSNN